MRYFEKNIHDGEIYDMVEDEAHMLGTGEEGSDE